MPRKVILLMDPTVDSAVALAVALYAPQVELLAVAATAGRTTAALATATVHDLIHRFDPPRLPRLGAALPAAYGQPTEPLVPSDAPVVSDRVTSGLHHPRPADKVIVEEVRQHKGEVSILVLGPLTALAVAMERDPELPKLLRSLIIVGGAWRTPGDAGPVSEHRFHCDPLAARIVLKSGVPTTLLSLDVTRHALFAPAELDDLFTGANPPCAVLRKLVPLHVHAMAQAQGIEGIYLRDVLAVAAAAEPAWVKAKPVAADVEPRGELTSGMLVVDQRPNHPKPNVDLAMETDLPAIRQFLKQTLATSCN